MVCSDIFSTVNSSFAKVSELLVLGDSGMRIKLNQEPTTNCWVLWSL